LKFHSAEKLGGDSELSFNNSWMRYALPQEGTHLQGTYDAANGRLENKEKRAHQHVGMLPLLHSGMMDRIKSMLLMSSFIVFSHRNDPQVSCLDYFNEI